MWMSNVVATTRRSLIFNYCSYVVKCHYFNMLIFLSFSFIEFTWQTDKWIPKIWYNWDNNHKVAISILEEHAGKANSCCLLPDLAHSFQLETLNWLYHKAWFFPSRKYVNFPRQKLLGFKIFLKVVVLMPPFDLSYSLSSLLPWNLLPLLFAARNLHFFLF